ncbi:cytochrome P450 4c21-like [Toxorhynchites rutilus septentrionalis]|uniref:cytochrome P450 4c21-like n=1 Tax=Toxorhynchites rutilus septentrionalis TaxID=329112 RepID=UPI00247A366E|nr:cytochrome P450 4c21-like [Toxorhynchites rutilus septentrionalis]
MLILFAIIVALLLLLDYVKKHQLNKFARAIPTMHPCYPLLGNSLMFLGKNERQRFENLKTTFREIDRMSKAWMGPQLVFGVNHPELVQKILTDPNCCEKPFYYDFVNMEHGLFSAKYQLWKPYRKSLNSTFNIKILHSFIPIFEKCARAMVARMMRRPMGVPVDILEFTSECTLEMVCGTTLGTEALHGDGKKEFLQNLRVLFSRVATRVLSAGIYSDLVYRMTKGYYEEARARKFCMNFAYKLIEERRTALEGQTSSKDSEDGFESRVPKIFIDQVLSTVNFETEFNVQNLSEQILTIIAAGHDTSAQMVAHTCLFLAMFPDLQEQLFAEIEENLTASETDIEADSIKNLPFLDKVIKESMRLAPVGPIIARTNLVDIELDGYRIPRGNIFVFNFYMLHRRKDVWGPNAEQFDPENFSPERSVGRHPFAFLPFSGGSRNCIGARYAMFSTKIMTIHIVRNFRLTTDIQYKDLQYLLDITLNLAFKHLISLERRK